MITRDDATGTVRSDALTIPLEVYRGRCLLCHPLPPESFESAAQPAGSRPSEYAHATAEAAAAAAAPEDQVPQGGLAATADGEGGSYIVPATEIPPSARKKAKGKGGRKPCAVPGCPKGSRGPICQQMCIAHHRQCLSLQCSPEDLAQVEGPSQTQGKASSAVNGNANRAEAIPQDHPSDAAAMPFPDDFDSMAAAAAASAADGGLPHHETADAADIVPRELEATAVGATEEDFHAILDALEPARHSTRSGRDFTSPLFGQL